LSWKGTQAILFSISTQIVQARPEFSYKPQCAIWDEQNTINNKKVKRMATIKFDLSNNSIPEKIEICTSIVDSIENNEHYPSPDPSVADVRTDIETLDKSYILNLKDKSLNNTRAVNKAEKVLDLRMKDVVNYVQHTSKGDELKIRSANFEVRSKPGPSQPAQTPEGLKGVLSNKEGCVELSWKSSANSRSYLIQMTLNPVDTSSWLLCASATTTKVTVSNLETGKKYWFRIAAMGVKNQQSDWSQPCPSIAG
jgi:hypothetical protein